MLTPFDDYPIHPSADPIAHPASGNPNHYDRYFFNGTHRQGEFFIGGAMGHYPVRGVIDGAFSVICDGVEHSVFASGAMPWDRSTAVGPLRVEVLEPMRTLRYVVEPNDFGLEADVVFRARTVAVEEPRQRRIDPDGIEVMDHTRLTQWGTWEGSVKVGGTEIRVDPGEVFAVRDRSWGTRPVGQPAPTNRPGREPRAFWLWAPLHFDDVCTHLAMHENPDGTRWLESALRVPLLAGPDAPVLCGPGDALAVPPSVPPSAAPPEELADIGYEIEWMPGRREMNWAALGFTDAAGAQHRIELERFYTFRMRGIGYMHPHWAHGSAHGQLEVGGESVGVDEFDPQDFASLHIQTLVRARYDDRVGVGVLEQLALGEHQPTGLTGILDGAPDSSAGVRHRSFLGHLPDAS